MSVRSIVWTISFVMMFAIGVVAAQAANYWDAVSDWTSTNTSSDTWQFFASPYQTNTNLVMTTHELDSGVDRWRWQYLYSRLFS